MKRKQSHLYLTVQLWSQVKNEMNAVPPPTPRFITASHLCHTSHLLVPGKGSLLPGLINDRCKVVRWNDDGKGWRRRCTRLQYMYRCQNNDGRACVPADTKIRETDDSAI